MSEFNVKPSVLFPGTYASAIAPQSVGAGATVTGAWISVKETKWVKLNLTMGAGAGTGALKLEQATSSGGAGAKDLVTAANLGITAQAAATQAQADFNVADNIDVDNSFAFVRASLTVTGGAGTLAAVTVELGPAYRQG